MIMLHKKNINSVFVIFYLSLLAGTVIIMIIIINLSNIKFD